MSARHRDSPLVKVTFDLAPDAWHGNATESVWAEALGEGRYRIRNVPFYARGIAVSDIVIATAIEGRLHFKQVLLRSGHSTYRAFLGENVDLDSPRFRTVWMPLEQLGCTLERATTHLLAIDIPPSADLQVAYRLLEAGETAGVWEFEEGHSAT